MCGCRTRRHSLSKERLTLSMPKDFMDSITASKGELRISGGVCSGNVSLKWAEEKSLCTPGRSCPCRVSDSSSRPSRSQGVQQKYGCQHKHRRLAGSDGEDRLAEVTTERASACTLACASASAQPDASALMTQIGTCSSGRALCGLHGLHAGRQRLC